MSESRIDHCRARFDPSFDAIMPVEQSMKLHQDAIEYERRKWHREHDAPPEGYGLDGRPLMRVQSGRVQSAETEGEG